MGIKGVEGERSYKQLMPLLIIFVDEKKLRGVGLRSNDCTGKLQIRKVCKIKSSVMFHSKTK